jgi:hypothetical protein
MSKKDLNMYQQIVDMELHDLENEVLDLENQIFDLYRYLDILWAYHPENPNFINPITSYNKTMEKVKGLEAKMDDLELKISTLKSAN